MALFPSDEWLTRYRDLINGSQEYGEAAEDWEGDVAFFLEAEPDRGATGFREPGLAEGRRRTMYHQPTPAAEWTLATTWQKKLTGRFQPD